jgi:hypothetical protein
MIKVQREYIQTAKEHLLAALITSTASGKKWFFPQDEITEEIMEKATMIALNLIAMDVVDTHECVVASDVLHIDDFCLSGEHNV